MSFVEELVNSEPDLACIETRRSLIFLSADRAWKIWKPTPDGSGSSDNLLTRRASCEAEIDRGALQAPGVYLGLVAITREADGRLRFGGSGEPVDWSIQMQRLPECDRADQRLECDRLGDEHLSKIAQHVAQFHDAAPSNSRIAGPATPEAIAAHIGWAFGRGGQLEPTDPTASDIREVEAWQHRFIEKNAELFRRRLRSGSVVEGHGDLCLENVYVDDTGGVLVVDGARRSPEFRLADVAADVGTLSLDLALHGRVDLAERFVAAYAQAANDYDLYAVIDFYESCRANLEAKTADQLRVDPEATQALRKKAERSAIRYGRAAIAFERRPFLPPMVVALSGLVATGKSSVARAIARQIAAPTISSDATSEFMIRSGVESKDETVHELDWERCFRAGFREEVYDEVFRRAEVALASGRPVVIDGCFGTRALRSRARELAKRFGTPFFFVECTAAEPVLRQRLCERSRSAGLDPNAWQKIFDDFSALWEPVEELASSEHVILDTGQSLDINVRILEDILPVWPEALQ